jgi:hypothetical protein
MIIIPASVFHFSSQPELFLLQILHTKAHRMPQIVLASSRTADSVSPCRSSRRCCSMSVLQGRTLVHSSDQSETFLVTETHNLPSICHKRCLR